MLNFKKELQGIVDRKVRQKSYAQGKADRKAERTEVLNTYLRQVMPDIKEVLQLAFKEEVVIKPPYKTCTEIRLNAYVERGRYEYDLRHDYCYNHPENHYFLIKNNCYEDKNIMIPFSFDDDLVKNKIALNNAIKALIALILEKEIRIKTA